MSKIKSYAVRLVAITLIFVWGCSDIKQSDYVNVELVKQGVKDNKIRRFKEEEVLQAAYFWGERIRLAVPPAIYARLSCESAISSAFLPDSLSKLVSSLVLYCQKPIEQSEKVQNLWEACRVATQQQNEIPAVIQKIGQDSLLYPIYLAQKDYPQGFAMLGLWLNRKEIIKTLY